MEPLHILSVLCRWSFAFGNRLDVPQHPLVDAPDERIAEQHPVRGRLEAHLVPRASLEARPSIGERHQTKLAAPRSEIAVEVRWRGVGIRTPFVKRARLQPYIEGETMSRFPHRDRLDERARREDAVAHSANPRAANLGPLRVRHPGSEDEVGRFCEWWELDDVPPHDRRRRVDDDRRANLAPIRGGRTAVQNRRRRQHQQGKHGMQNRSAIAKGDTAPLRRTYRTDADAERRGHQETERTFSRGKNEHAQNTSEGEQDDLLALALRRRVASIEQKRAQRADDEWCSQKERDPIARQPVDAECEHRQAESRTSAHRKEGGWQPMLVRARLLDDAIGAPRLGNALSTAMHTQLAPGTKKRSAHHADRPASSARRMLMLTPIHRNGSAHNASTGSSDGGADRSFVYASVATGLK